MKSLKRMALGVSAGTLALAGLGMAGASAASADTGWQSVPGSPDCGNWDYHSGGVGYGWVSINTFANNASCYLQVYAKCSDGSWIAGDVNHFVPYQPDMYARCGNGSVVTHFGIEVELVDGTWLSYQKA